jgi:stress response protein YsnF
MGLTVIGIFEDSTNAYEAVEKLTSSGFSTSDIDVSDNENYDRSTTDESYEEEDGITRFFNNLFGSNDRSKYYSEVTRRSSTLVTVHAQSEQEAHRAADILDNYGAVDVDERAAEYGYNTDLESDDDYNFQNRDYDRDYDVENRDYDSDSNETRSIPIIEEEMNVGKREIVTGSVKIRSRIINKPVEETLRLRHERVSVERKPVNRAATESDMKHFRESERELTERKEVPVVDKQARVVEEVRLKKEVEQREETIKDNVRKTQVDIDEHHDENRDVRNRRDDDDYSDKNRELL